jgi:hypothetical protein
MSPIMGRDGCHLCGVRQVFEISKVCNNSKNAIMARMTKLFFNMWVWNNGL